MEQIELKDNKLISGYMPSLIGYSLFSKDDFEKKFVSKKFLKFHKKLNKDDLNGLKKLLLSGINFVEKIMKYN